MNFAKMIEILKWVKDNRMAGRLTLGSESPYLCDNVSSFPGRCNATYNDPVSASARCIRADISQEINGKFGANRFLGYDDGEIDGADDSNYFPDVIAFREDMIDRLIARYEAEVAA